MMRVVLSLLFLLYSIRAEDNLTNKEKWPVRSFKNFWGLLATGTDGKVEETEEYILIQSPINKHYLNYLYLKKGCIDYTRLVKRFNGKRHILYVDAQAKVNVNPRKYQKSDQFENMVLPTSALKELPCRDGVEIKPVKTKEEFRQWKKLAHERSRIPRHIINKMFEPANPLKNKNIYMKIAYYYGVPAGTSLSYNEGPYTSFYWVGVQKPYRQNGIATMLTMDAVKAARARGEKWIAIQASTLGMHVYPRLGFKSVGQYTTYLSR